MLYSTTPPRGKNPSHARHPKTVRTAPPPHPVVDSLQMGAQRSDGNRRADRSPMWYAPEFCYNKRLIIRQGRRK
ncbi:MAG: hypothetical protein ACOYJQ_05475 [Pseudochelatococcus sp.]|jgi:hypothetical protein|uniref:hypothetical protein n=1 Tax=Pseudochelatococcus sp. TaxID=2020869 RepID=UPI003D8B5F6F